MKKTTTTLAILAALGLAACGSAGGDTPAAAPVSTIAEVMEDKSADATAVDATEDKTADTTAVGDAVEDKSGDAMTDATAVDAMEDKTTDTTPASDAMTLPTWQTMQFTDVDGVTFTLDDFHGTPVFVENFATWCPNCKKQLADTNTAAQQLGDKAVFIALSVETDISTSDVADYAASNGFDAIRFAVMTPESLAAFVDDLGQSAANPPSTPKFVIDPMGHAGELVTGFESADEIVAKLGTTG